jgi:hypothetical protein
MPRLSRISAMPLMPMPPIPMKCACCEVANMVTNVPSMPLKSPFPEPGTTTTCIFGPLASMVAKCCRAKLPYLPSSVPVTTSMAT